MELECPHEISKSRVCKHLIDVRRCCECQIETFCELGNVIPKDVMNNILKPMISTKGSRVINIGKTYESIGEVKDTYNLCYNFLCHNQRISNVRIVCEGSEEMQLGFAAAIYARYAYLDDEILDLNGMPDLCARTYLRRTCVDLFTKYPDTPAFLKMFPLSISGNKGYNFVAIENIAEFAIGFRKGCAMEIDVIHPDYDGFEVAYSQVHMLEPFDPWTPGCMIQKHEGSISIETTNLEWPDTCHAYWYFV